MQIDDFFVLYYGQYLHQLENVSSTANWILSLACINYERSTQLNTTDLIKIGIMSFVTVF